MGDGRPSTEEATAPAADEDHTAATGAGAVSCTKYFDALWFCYSPVHQLKRYYVNGDVDDCVSHWSTLVACLKQKTRFRVADGEEALPAQPCMWSIRSPAEAKAFWSRDFPEGGGANPEDAKSTKEDNKTPMA
jgi:hypothetical protein